MTYKSSVDKFFDRDALESWAQLTGAGDGDLILVMSGARVKTLEALGVLRLEMGNRLGLRDKDHYAPLWVYDFPLLEWDEETQRFYAKHHPFTAPKPEDLDKFYSDDPKDLEQVSANAYDFVLNGTEVGGGSVRIHDKDMQERMFKVLGMSQEEVKAKFSFIINAFQYGAPPHGGIAFGFDRWCSLFGGSESIRDFIAFPKNNSGRDVMLDAPSEIDALQKKELGLS
jgi:aspartyl-tRNA synthetase